jgi:periplasmic protein TonB
VARNPLLRKIIFIWILGLSILAQAQFKPTRIRVSEKASEAFIESKVPPKYPDEARRKHIQGALVIKAKISKEGVVESLDVLSGDPLLAPAATDTVKQRKYKPYLLNGFPKGRRNSRHHHFHPFG